MFREAADRYLGTQSDAAFKGLEQAAGATIDDILNGDPGKKGAALGAIGSMFFPSGPSKFGKFAGKTGGRLGNTATRAQISEIATTLESRGYTITGGGGRSAEEFLKPLGGGRKGGSYIDITATHPNYPTLRINTVDVYKSGLPTLRELDNASRIRTQIAPGEHLLLIPKR